jgi:cytochrome c biogenesis protein CcmG/thiol:disulfide interchange protein DsbE
LIFLAAVGLIALLVYGITDQNGRPQVGEAAPDFTLTLFEGEQISLADLRGQVVVVNFWASWCPPCRDEAPVLEVGWRRYKEQGVTVLGVDYMDTAPAAREFMEEYDISYPNGPDLGSRISRAYMIRGVPETFFIDRQGQIADVVIGPVTETRLTETLDRLLAGSAGDEEQAPAEDRTMTERTAEVTG